MPSPRGGPSTASPAIESAPAVATSSPATNLSSVLFPQPLGPSRLMKAPCWMASETPAKAGTSPLGEAYVFDRLSMQMCRRFSTASVISQGLAPFYPEHILARLSNRAKLSAKEFYRHGSS